MRFGATVAGASASRADDPAAHDRVRAVHAGSSSALGGKEVERPIGSSAAGSAHVRIAPAMASGTNPDLHVWRGDWFGHFFGLVSNCLQTLRKGHS